MEWLVYFIKVKEHPVAHLVASYKISLIVFKGITTNKQGNMAEESCDHLAIAGKI